MYAMVDVMRTRLAGTSAQVVGYGHLGDGNLHLNVWTPTYDKHVAEKIEPYLFEQTGENEMGYDGYRVECIIWMCVGCDMYGCMSYVIDVICGMHTPS